MKLVIAVECAVIATRCPRQAGQNGSSSNSWGGLLLPPQMEVARDEAEFGRLLTELLVAEQANWSDLLHLVDYGSGHAVSGWGAAILPYLGCIDVCLLSDGQRRDLNVCEFMAWQDSIAAWDSVEQGHFALAAARFSDVLIMEAPSGAATTSMASLLLQTALKKDVTSLLEVFWPLIQQPTLDAEETRLRVSLQLSALVGAGVPADTSAAKEVERLTDLVLQESHVRELGWPSDEIRTSILILSRERSSAEEWRLPGQLASGVERFGDALDWSAAIRDVEMLCAIAGEAPGTSPQLATDVIELLVAVEKHCSLRPMIRVLHEVLEKFASASHNAAYVYAAEAFIRRALALDEESVELIICLGHVLQASYLIDSARERLDEAITLYMEHAGDEAPQELRAELLADAAVVYVMRYDAVGSVGDLERAISIGDAAMRLTEHDSRRMGERMRTVAGALRRAGEHFNRKANRAQARTLLVSALALPNLPPEMPESLAQSLLGLDLLDGALSAEGRNAINVMRAAANSDRDSLTRARRVMTLAQSLRLLHREHPDRQLLVEAVELIVAALLATPVASDEFVGLLSCLANLAGEGDLPRSLRDPTRLAACLIARSRSSSLFHHTSTGWLSDLLADPEADSQALRLAGSFAANAARRVVLTQSTMVDKLSWLEGQTHMAGALFDRLVSRDEWVDAVELSENLRTITISERLILTTLPEGETFNDSLRYLARQVVRKLASSPDAWPANSQASDELALLQQELFSGLGNDIRRHLQLGGFTLGTLQRAVESEYVAYVSAYGGRVSVVVITQDQILGRNREIANFEFSDLVQQYFDAYEARTVRYARWVETYDVTIAWLGKHLRPLIADLVPDDASLVLVPIGFMSLLPLQCATWNQGTARHYLIDHYEMRYAPNAASALRVRANESHPRALLAGPVDHERPYLQLESNLLRPAFDEWAREELDAEAVSRLLSRNRWVHIASHAQFDPGNWHGSTIELGSGEAMDLSTLLDAELHSLGVVVLSACETAPPSMRVPDEAWGLPGALLSSGVLTVVAALWAVDDFAAYCFMVEFYDCLESGPASPSTAVSAAVRSASLRLRHSLHSEVLLASLPESGRERIRHGELRHPLAWGAFAAYGGK